MDSTYCVVRPSGNVIVSIMYSRQDKKFHFVNLTKGHICECAFDTKFDAINDMEKMMRERKIQNYFKI